MSPSRIPNATSHDEEQPLLQSERPEKLSWSSFARQLAVLSYLRLIDPLNFTQIFPYINQFLADLHVTEDASKIGLYSGMVESAFAFTQLLAIYPWASFSDRVGRKPVILAGVLGLTCATLVFGLSPNFGMMLAARALAGLFSGNVPIIPTVLCEITDASNQAFAFSVFAVWWPIGSIIGPLLGGFTSNPKILPEIFRHQIFDDHPYFLPCLIVAGINIGAVLSTHFYLQETVQKKEHSTPRPSFSATAKTLLALPVFRTLCASAFTMSFVTVCFEVVFVLFCYSPIGQGGLGLSVQQIGFSLGFSGLAAALTQCFLLPVLLKRYDPAILLYYCVNVWPPVYLALPVLNVVARLGLGASGKLGADHGAILWIGIAAVLAAARVGFWPYTINMLLVKEHTPAPVLGSANGLLQLFICMSRAFGPVVVSTLFSVSVSKNLLSGYLWAVSLSVFGLAGTYLARQIVQRRQNNPVS